MGTALRSFTDPIIDCMQTAYGYAICNKGQQASSIAAIWANHHMIMGPPEESVVSQHSYCPNDDKTWCKYHKDKIFNTNIYDRSKCLPFVFREILTRLYSPVDACQRGFTQNESINNTIWSKYPKRVYVAKADLLFLFANQMK